MDFTYLQRIERRAKFSFLRSAIGYGIATVFIAFGCLALVAPRPIVVLSTNPTVAPRFAEAREHKVTTVDGERLVRHVAKLIHGWAASTYEKDYSAATPFLVAPLKARFDRDVVRKIDVDPSISKTGKATIYYANATSGLVNEVHFPDSDDPTWRWSEQGGILHVYVPVILETQPEEGAPVNTPHARKTLELKASLVPVPFTKLNPYGLKVGFWDAKEVD